jgi:hypothetical protein
LGIETIIGDPFDGRLENGRLRWGSVNTKASLGLVLALLEDMQHRGEVLKPNLLVCAVEEIGCSGPALRPRARSHPRSTGGGRSDDVRTNLHHKGAAVLLRACES